ncbi:MAG TPA: LysR family transcriptional regulator [Pseudolabrys sp.]|nr:LysR family transcriptional regulator [Pseudolabrys sp.]
MSAKLSLSFNHLQHFLAIADQGSLRAAAESLGLSQPAVSKSLRALEASLGVPLINRDARGSSLTQYGKVLYARAKLIGNEVDRVTQEVREMAGIGRGKVTLGASAIPSLLLVPEAVARFRERFPEINIDFIGGMPSVLLPRLQDGSLDFVVGPKPGGPMAGSFHTTPLFKVPACLVVRKGHPLAKAKSLKDFVGAEWVLSSSAAQAESTLHASFAACKLPPANVVVRVESLLAAYSFVATTPYVGLLPYYSRNESLFLRNISYVEVPELVVIESYELFTREGAQPSAAAGKLIAHIKEQVKRMKRQAELQLA